MKICREIFLEKHTRTISHVTSKNFSKQKFVCWTFGVAFQGRGGEGEIKINACFLLTLNNKQFVMGKPAGIYLFKVSNKNTIIMCEFISKSTIMTPERRQWRRSGVITINFKQFSHIATVFPFLALNKLMPAEKIRDFCSDYFENTVKSTKLNLALCSPKSLLSLIQLQYRAIFPTKWFNLLSKYIERRQKKAQSYQKGTKRLPKAPGVLNDFKNIFNH